MATPPPSINIVNTMHTMGSYIASVCFFVPMRTHGGRKVQVG